MDLRRLTRFFGLCFLLTMGVLVLWFAIYILGGDLMFDVHAKLFPMEEDEFVEMNYEGMAFLKILSWVLFLVPYLALKILGRENNPRRASSG